MSPPCFLNHNYCKKYLLVVFECCNLLKMSFVSKTFLLKFDQKRINSKAEIRHVNANKLLTYTVIYVDWQYIYKTTIITLYL